MGNSFLFFEEHEADGHDPEKSRDRNGPVKQVLYPGQNDSCPHEDYCSAWGFKVISGEKAEQEVTDNETCQDAKNDGNGDRRKLCNPVDRPSSVHTEKNSEDDDDEDVVDGRGAQNERGDPFLRSLSPLHEIDHKRNHHRRGNCSKDAAEYRGLKPGHTEQCWCQ